MTLAGAPMACAAVSGAITLAAGGTIGQALTAAALSFAQMGVWTVVGEALKVAGATVANLGVVGTAVVKAAVHGVVGGAMAVAQGGDFLQGFAANAVGGAAGVVGGESGWFGSPGSLDDGMLLVRTAISAAAGCAAASITGGKCADGAVTAAFANLFNFEGAARFAAANSGNAVAWGASSTLWWMWRALMPVTATAAMVLSSSPAGVGSDVCDVACRLSISDDAVAYEATRVHGNSAASKQPTDLYHLVDRTSGEIAKIGITSNPSGRYSQTYLNANNVRYEPQYGFASRYPAMVAENIELHSFYFTHGRLPHLNVTFR